MKLGRTFLLLCPNHNEVGIVRVIRDEAGTACQLRFLVSLTNPSEPLDVPIPESARYLDPLDREGIVAHDALFLGGFSVPRTYQLASNRLLLATNTR